MISFHNILSIHGCGICIITKCNGQFCRFVSFTGSGSTLQDDLFLLLKKFYLFHISWNIIIVYIYAK